MRYDLTNPDDAATAVGLLETRIEELRTALDEAREREKRIASTLRYAADAPDDPEMPDWLREMQHHARRYLAATSPPENQEPA